MPPRLSRNPVRIALSHHRLRDAGVARRIVAHTGLAPPCLVVEAGAGEGVLTQALLPCATRIIAVERERAFWERLQARFACEPKVRPVLGDIRSFRFPSEPYAFVANMPFSITSEVLRLVLHGQRPPERACLVLQRDAAFHWAGVGRSSVVSVLTHVAWEMEIPLVLRRRDFVPRPSVDCVLLVARRRSQLLLPPRDMPRFERFVRTGFGRGRDNLSQNLRGPLSHRAFCRAADELGIGRDAIPSELSGEQWVELFRRAGAQRNQTSARGGAKA